MSMIDLAVITEDDVTRLLEFMLAAGLRRAKDAGDDPLVFRDAYYHVLKGLPAKAVQEVIEAACQNERFIPPASELRDRAWKLVKREATARPLIPEDLFATGTDQLGPIARMMQVSTAKDRGLPLADAITCPDEACRCFAVPVRVPFDHPLGGFPPIITAPLRRDHDKPAPRYVRWVWMHLAINDPVLVLVPKDQRK